MVDTPRCASLLAYSTAAAGHGSRRNEPMLENMQQRCDILLDACVEELFDDLIAASSGMSWVSNAQISELSSGTCPATVAATADSSARRRRPRPPFGNHRGARTPVHTHNNTPDQRSRTNQWSFWVRRTTAAHISVCCQHDARIDIPGCNWRQPLDLGGTHETPIRATQRSC
jgi:hypothetical protein